MKIYISTPVTSRNEETMEERLGAARTRCWQLALRILSLPGLNEAERTRTSTSTGSEPPTDGWTVEQHVHRGMEPPQHDKYLLWSSILSETDTRFPIKRFNASKCKHILISLGNTRVKTDSQGRFAKDKRSERNDSILPEDATHFGDAVDKRVWTKYGELLKQNDWFVGARI